MKKWMNTLFFGSLFIVAIILETYGMVVLEGNLFSVIALGVVVLITGYLFMDSIRSKLKQGSEDAKFYFDRVLNEESEQRTERHTEIVNLQKASYTATKKNALLLTEQFTEVLTRLEALEENNARSLQKIIELQRTSLEGQKNALNLEISYSKDNTRKIIEAIKEEHQEHDLNEQLTMILQAMEENNRLLREQIQQGAKAENRYASYDAKAEALEMNTDFLEDSTQEFEVNTDFMEDDAQEFEVNTGFMEDSTQEVEVNTDFMEDDAQEFEVNTDFMEDNTQPMEVNEGFVEDSTRLNEANIEPFEAKTQPLTVDVNSYEDELLTSGQSTTKGFTEDTSVIEDSNIDEDANFTEDFYSDLNVTDHINDFLSIEAEEEIEENTPETDWPIQDELEPEADNHADNMEESDKKVAAHYDDPNKALTADEIAALFASFGN